MPLEICSSWSAACALCMIQYGKINSQSWLYQMVAGKTIIPIYQAGKAAAAANKTLTEWTDRRVVTLVR